MVTRLRDEKKKKRRLSKKGPSSQPHQVTLVTIMRLTNHKLTLKDKVKT